MSKRKAAKKSNKKLNFLKKIFSFKKSSLLAALAAIFIVAAAAFAGSQGTRESVTNGFYKTLAGLGFDVAVPEISVIKDCGMYSEEPELCAGTPGCKYATTNKTVKCSENDCKGAKPQDGCEWVVSGAGCSGNSLCKQQKDFSACVETSGCNWSWGGAGSCEGSYKTQIGQCQGVPIGTPDPDAIPTPKPTADPNSKVFCSDKNDKLTIPVGGPYFFQTGICAYCEDPKNGNNQGNWKTYEASKFPKKCEGVYNPKTGDNKVCWKNGHQYPTGTIIGTQRCENSVWKELEKCSSPSTSCNPKTRTQTTCLSDANGFKIKEVTKSCAYGCNPDNSACADKPNNPPPAPEKDCTFVPPTSTKYAKTIKSGAELCSTDKHSFARCQDGKPEFISCGTYDTCEQTTGSTAKCIDNGNNPNDLRDCTKNFVHGQSKCSADKKSVISCYDGKESTKGCSGNPAESCIQINSSLVKTIAQCKVINDPNDRTYNYSCGYHSGAYSYIKREAKTGQVVEATPCPDKCSVALGGCYFDTPQEDYILKTTYECDGTNRMKVEVWKIKGTIRTIDRECKDLKCNSSTNNCNPQPPQNGECNIGDPDQCSKSGNVQSCVLYYPNSGTIWRDKQICSDGCDYTGEGGTAQCKPRPSLLNPGDKCDGKNDARCAGGCTWKLFKGYTCNPVPKPDPTKCTPGEPNRCKESVGYIEYCESNTSKWEYLYPLCGVNGCDMNGPGGTARCAPEPTSLLPGDRCKGPDDNRCTQNSTCQKTGLFGWGGYKCVVTPPPAVCVKGEQRCDGNDSQKCNKLGQWEPYVNCTSISRRCTEKSDGKAICEYCKPEISGTGYCTDELMKENAKKYQN